MKQNHFRAQSCFTRIISVFILISFIVTSIIPYSYAQTLPQISFNLPQVGSMITTSVGYSPAIIRGVSVVPDNPLQFNFIVNTGDENLKDQAFKDESTKLIKYFLAAITVPEEEMWVNLSPYEKSRVIPDGLGITQMGIDMLAQDYMLKQLTASMIYPENEFGRAFWSRVYEKTQLKFGTTEIPMDTFNKIWIVPDQAAVYEHNGTAFVIERHLKVMLEEDLKGKEWDMVRRGDKEDQTNEKISLTTQVIREVLIPEIEKEVNEGKNFAPLRQIYNSVILASWYKRALQESLLGKVYSDQNKTKGIDVDDKSTKQKIYERYLETFKKGVYNYIKEDYEPVSQSVVTRKYISGGAEAGLAGHPYVYRGDVASLSEDQRRFMGADAAGLGGSKDMAVTADLLENTTDAAVLGVSPQTDAAMKGLTEEIAETFYLKAGPQVQQLVNSVQEVVGGKRIDALSFIVGVIESRIEKPTPTYEADYQNLAQDVKDKLEEIAKKNTLISSERGPAPIIGLFNVIYLGLNNFIQLGKRSAADRASTAENVFSLDIEVLLREVGNPADLRSLVASKQDEIQNALSLPLSVNRRNAIIGIVDSLRLSDWNEDQNFREEFIKALEMPEPAVKPTALEIQREFLIRQVLKEYQVDEQSLRIKVGDHYEIYKQLPNLEFVVNKILGFEKTRFIERILIQLPDYKYSSQQKKAIAALIRGEGNLSPELRTAIQDKKILEVKRFLLSIFETKLKLITKLEANRIKSGSLDEPVALVINALADELMKMKIDAAMLISRVKEIARNTGINELQISYQLASAIDARSFLVAISRMLDQEPIVILEKLADSRFVEGVDLDNLTFKLINPNLFTDEDLFRKLLKTINEGSDVKLLDLDIDHTLFQFVNPEKFSIDSQKFTPQDKQKLTKEIVNLKERADLRNQQEVRRWRQEAVKAQQVIEEQKALSERKPIDPQKALIDYVKNLPADGPIVPDAVLNEINGQSGRLALTARDEAKLKKIKEEYSLRITMEAAAEIWLRKIPHREKDIRDIVDNKEMSVEAKKAHLIEFFNTLAETTEDIYIIKDIVQMLTMRSDEISINNAMQYLEKNTDSASKKKIKLIKTFQNKKEDEEFSKDEIKAMIQVLKDTADAFGMRIIQRNANRSGVIFVTKVTEGQGLGGRDDVPEAFKAGKIYVPKYLEGEMDDIKAAVERSDEFYVSKFGTIHLIAHKNTDVVEGTNETVGPSSPLGGSQNKSGGTSTITIGQGVNSLGNAPDAYVGQIFTNLGNYADEFKRRTAEDYKDEEGNPYSLNDIKLYSMHPEAILEYLRFLAEIHLRDADAELNDRLKNVATQKEARQIIGDEKLNQAILNLQEEIVIMGRARETAFVEAMAKLEDIIPGFEVVLEGDFKEVKEWSKYPIANKNWDEVKKKKGVLKITVIADGTVVHGLKAVMPTEIYEKVSGMKYGWHKTMLTIGGTAEGYMNLAGAKIFEKFGAIGLFRTYSSYIGENAEGGKALDHKRWNVFPEDEQQEFYETGLDPTIVKQILDGKKKFDLTSVKGNVFGSFSFITNNQVFQQEAPHMDGEDVVARSLNFSLENGKIKIELVEGRGKPKDILDRKRNPMTYRVIGGFYADAATTTETVQLPSSDDAMTALSQSDIAKELVSLKVPAQVIEELKVGSFSGAQANALLSYARVLTNSGQMDFLARWDAVGVNVDQKRALLDQVAEFNRYPSQGDISGLEQIQKNAVVRRISNFRRESDYPDLKPSLADKVNLDLGTPDHDRYTEEGIMKAGNNMVWALPAGGKGSRLGFKGLKTSIPFDTVTNRSFMEFYIQNILEAQKRANQANGENKEAAFVLMTNAENHDDMVSDLEKNGYYGLNGLTVIDTDTEEAQYDAADGKMYVYNRVNGTRREMKQIVVVSQSMVPGFNDGENKDIADETQIKGKLILDNNNPYRLVMGAHGHMDIHMLMAKAGLSQAYAQKGLLGTQFFQDTQAQNFNAIWANIGYALEQKKKASFIGIQRKPGENVGLILKLTNTKTGENQVTVVEYSQINDLLKSFADDPDVQAAFLNADGTEKTDSNGFALSAGNPNSFWMEENALADLQQNRLTSIKEMINPKAGTGEYRLEGMMQHIVGLLKADEVGITQQKTRESFSSVKNDWPNAQKAAKAGIYPEDLARAAMNYERTNRLMWQAAGAVLNVEGDEVVMHGIPVRMGAKITWDRSWALTPADVRKNVRPASPGAVRLSNNAILNIEGEGAGNVIFESLDLDGYLLIKNPNPNVYLTVRRGMVSNEGWRLRILSDDEIKNGGPGISEIDRMYGYKYEGRERSFPNGLIDMSGYDPGRYVIGDDGVVRNEERAEQSKGQELYEDRSILNWHSPSGKTLEQVLNSIVKEYDIRGFDGYGDPKKYPQQFDEVLLQWIGRALGTTPFHSEILNRTVQLKPGDTFVIAGDNGPSTSWVLDNFIEGLRDTGVNVINLGVTVSDHLYASVSNLGAQGGLYVTRSHVEIGTNGAKPIIGGITLYADMLMGLKEQILSGKYRKAEKRGDLLTADLDQRDAFRNKAEKMFKDSLREEFGGLKQLLTEQPMKIAFNLNGGSATGYGDFIREVVGDQFIVDVFRQESDPMNENGGLADPSRADDTALSHPKADIMKYSREHPDVIVFNYDLDADRVSIVWGGKLYLGDEMFYPVIEYQLDPNLNPYAELYKTIYFDSRMKNGVKEMVEAFGGIAKLHPKGHSKVKISMQKDLEDLAKSEGKTVDQFLNDHPGFKILQPEFSLHMFATNKKGEPFDGGIRFSLLWLEIFSKIKAKYGKPDMTLQEYIDINKQRGHIKPSVALDEQRLPSTDENKKDVMLRMREKVLAHFKGREDFEHLTEWRGNVQGKPYQLIDVEGVFDLTTPEGKVFWGWSNTSPKVAYGSQSKDENTLAKITGALVALYIHSRNEIASEKGVDLPKIDPLETSGTMKLFNVYQLIPASTSEDEKARINAEMTKKLEAKLLRKYPTVESALQGLDAAALAVPVKSAPANTDAAILASARKPAIPVKQNDSTPVGGINLNPKLINLQIKRDGNGVPLPINQQPITDMKIDGFLPVIIQVTPVNIPLLLGMTPEENKEKPTDLSYNLSKADRPKKFEFAGVE